MNSKFPDDLLSAFHDGEVTPSEETVVQIRSKASSEARQELQDYERMSQLLRELPRQTAPPEFASAVLQKAERESLIPSEAGLAGTTVGSRSIRLSRRQLWTFGAVGVATVAAGIIALVNLPGVHHQRPAAKPVIAVAQRDEPATSTAMARSLPRTAEAIVDNKSMLGAKGAPGATNGPHVWGFAKSSAPSPAAALGASSAPARQVAAPVATAREAGAAKVSNLDASHLTFPADLKTAKVGEAVDALEKDGDRVAVVRLTVVNQAEGLAGIQKLLVANDRRAVNNAAEKDKLSALYSLPKQGVAVDSSSKAQGRGDLVCVYVEGTRDDLVAVLHDVQNESFFQQMEVTSITAAQLERLSRRAVSPQNGKSEPVSLRQQVVTLPVAALSEIHSDKESAQPDEYKLMYEYANPALGKKSAPVAGRTLPRSLAQPQPKAQASQAGPVEAPRRAASILREEEKVAGGGRSAKRKERVPPREAAKVADAGKRSVQVFFVIDDQSAPSSARTPVIAHRPTAAPKPAAAKPAP